MKLSIVIVHYNTPEFLYTCLVSLIGDRGLPKLWEVIIVDNASANSKQQIANSKKKYQNSNVHFVMNKENVGFSKANNIGIAKSKGEYVLLLNPDTIVSQHAIEHIVSYMEKHEDVGVSTCRVELPLGTIDDACHRGFPTPWNAFFHFSGISNVFPKSKLLNGYHLGYQDMNRVHEIDACVGAFMMIRRTVGDSVDWLDEDYFWYGEDIDICYRVKQGGSKIVYIPDVKITHYKGVSSGIKKDSQEHTSATAQTKAKAQTARFEAMRIFYKKNYRSKYPWVVTRATETGINLIERFVS